MNNKRKMKKKKKNKNGLTNPYPERASWKAIDAEPPLHLPPPVKCPPSKLPF
jgi:hypothetical protein